MLVLQCHVNINARKTLFENEHFRNYDYFAFILSCSASLDEEHYNWTTRNATKVNRKKEKETDCCELTLPWQFHAVTFVWPKEKVRLPRATGLLLNQLIYRHNQFVTLSVLRVLCRNEDLTA